MVFSFLCTKSWFLLGFPGFPGLLRLKTMVFTWFSWFSWSFEALRTYCQRSKAKDKLQGFNKPGKPRKNNDFVHKKLKTIVFTWFSWFPWSANAENHCFYLVFLVFMVF